MLLDAFRDSRSWASSVWYRWVLSPGTDPESLVDRGGLKSPFGGLTRALGWRNLPGSSEAWREAAHRASQQLLSALGPWSRTLLAVLFLLALKKLLSGWRSLHWSRKDPQVLLARFAKGVTRAIRAPNNGLDRQWSDTLLELRFSGMTAKSRERRRATGSLWQVVRDYWGGSV